MASLLRDRPSAYGRRLGLLLGPTVLLGFLWIASGLGLPAWLAPHSARLQGLVTTFLGIVIEALPFLLAGVLVSVIFQRFVTPERLARWAPGSAAGSALAGSLLGLGFPVCECGAIPASRMLLRKGAPMPLGIAFALAAPVVNPIVILSTLAAFGDWRWAAARVGFTIAIAALIACIVGAGIGREHVLAPGALQAGGDAEPGCGCGDPAHHGDDQHGAAWGAMLAHGAQELLEMSQYLIGGALLAAALQTFLPQAFLVGLLENPALGLFAPAAAILVMMLVALALSVCSTVDAFLALAFSSLVHPGAIMAFLVFGPMIDIKSGLMLASTFRRPAVAAMALLAASFTVVAGLIVFVVVK